MHVVRSRRQVLRNHRTRKADKAAINRHRALFFNRRQNPYVDNMSRIRIRDRLSIGPDTMSPQALSTMGFRQKMSYYRGDDFFQDGIQDDGYRASKSKAAMGSSKSKSSKGRPIMIILVPRGESICASASVLMCLCLCFCDRLIMFFTSKTRKTNFQADSFP
jgi:hypothetical protein